MIPKIIHYCWFGGKSIPNEVRQYIDSWKEKCPDYKIVQWDENNFDINNTISYVKEAYKCKKWAFVTDYVRLWVVYNHGGIYLDTDVELIKSMDALIQYDAFFGFERDKYINTGLGFGAVRGCDLLKQMMDIYEKMHFASSSGEMNIITCPTINTKILMGVGMKQNGKTQIVNNCIFLGSEYLSPLDYVSGKLKVTDNTVSIHHYKASWMNENERNNFDEQNAFMSKYGEKLGKIFYILKSKGFLGLLNISIKKIKRIKLKRIRK